MRERIGVDAPISDSELRIKTLPSYDRDLLKIDFQRVAAVVTKTELPLTLIAMLVEARPGYALG